MINPGYLILEYMKNTCRSVPERVESFLKIPAANPKQNLQDLYKAVYETFNGV